MSDDAKHNSEFAEVLGRLENSLETPVVPGELLPWLKAAAEPLRRASELYQTRVGQVHEELRGAIARQDMDLAARVKKLQKSHDQIEVAWRGTQDKLTQLIQSAEESEPHESKHDQAVEQFRDDALSLIIEVRKHEAAVTTWYVEAFQRDRGVAD